LPSKAKALLANPCTMKKERDREREREREREKERERRKEGRRPRAKQLQCVLFQSGKKKGCQDHDYSSVQC
jgi:hypothetical protein